MRSPFLLLLLAAEICAPGAAAQHPEFGSPEPRPLHAQLASADAVAVARVSEVGLGRIRMTDARSVLGKVPASFELKRAPSAPPTLAPGDRALLLLRGARTPYLLVSEPLELITLSDESEVAAWTSGLRALRAAGSQGSEIARVYAGWLDAAPPLQLASAIGLAHEDVPESAFGPDLAKQLASISISNKDANLRRAAARAAVRSPEGRRQLFARLPANDPVVLTTALRVMAIDTEAAFEILLRALRHEDTEIRRAALRFTSGVANDRRVHAQLMKIASEDPDPKLRDQARRIIQARPGRTAAP